MPHRVMITGVSGFAGSFLAELLLDSGDAVLGCSANGAWDASSPDELRERVELVAWDLADPGGIPADSRRRIAEFRPDCIYHLAAMSVPEDCGEGEPVAQAVAVNIVGTRRVMELAAAVEPRPRVLFTSSSHVYARVSPESPLVDETAAVGPWRGYGRTKLAAEAEVLRAVSERACDAVIARSFQHAGPRQNPRMMLAQWARQFAIGGTEPIRVHTLDAQVDLTDGRDAVRAYQLLMERGRRGEIYNVGSGIGRPSGEILDLLRRMAGSTRAIVETRPGRRQDPIADTTRLTQLTGWRPRIPLGTTVADTLAWWRARL